jgi:GMP synthase (glutamine-hydrolysing)
VLGICYGHQLMAKDLDGRVSRGITKEYGHSKLHHEASPLFRGLPDRDLTVWMSHGDTVSDAPAGFTIMGETDDCKIAAMQHAERRLFGLQFHPEVVHTEFGTEIYRNFVFDVCACTADWDPRARVEQVMEEIRTRAAGRKVFFLISGGVDSTVAFYCCYRALGAGRVLGLYVDTGLHARGRRRGHRAPRARGRARGDPRGLTAAPISSGGWPGVTNPETKRPIIGDTFISVQGGGVRHGSGLRDAEWMLGQGTIYPDTIESGGAKHSAKIKTHHNRVERIQALIEQGKVIEPLVELYKDEVPRAGRAARIAARGCLAPSVPGPGLAVRCLCSETTAPVEAAPMALPAGVRGFIVPVRTVGVQGDERSYSKLLAVEGFADAETAGAFARRITNEHRTINRVAVIAFRRDGHGMEGLSIHPATLTRERVALLREGGRSRHAPRAQARALRRHLAVPRGHGAAGRSTRPGDARAAPGELARRHDGGLRAADAGGPRGAGRRPGPAARRRRRALRRHQQAAGHHRARVSRLSCSTLSSSTCTSTRSTAFWTAPPSSRSWWPRPRS